MCVDFDIFPIVIKYSEKTDAGASEKRSFAFGRILLATDKILFDSRPKQDAYSGALE